MSNLIILMFIESLMALLSIYVYRKDVFAPFTLTIVLMLLSTFFCILSQDLWKMELKTETLLVIVSGLSMMFLGNFFSYYLAYLNKRHPHYYIIKESLTNTIFSSLSCKNNKRPPKLGIWYKCGFVMRLIISLISVICTYLYIKEMMALIVVANLEDATGVGDAKDLLASGEYAINPIVKQFYKLVIALAYISFFLLSNSVICKRKVNYYYLLFVPITCGIIISVAAGNRIEIFKIILSYFFIFVIQWRSMNYWRCYSLNKILKYGLPIGIVFVSFFVFLRTITKPQGEAQSSGENVLNYISYYIGSPIQVLNIYITEGTYKWTPPVPMGGTFSGIYKILNEHDLIRDVKSKKSSFVYIGGNSDIHGNAATFFSSPYIDAGIFGVLIICLATYFIFGLFYYRFVVFSKNTIKNNEILLVYSYCFSNVVGLAFYDTNIKSIIGQTGILQIIVLCVIFQFLFKYTITNKIILCK